MSHRLRMVAGHERTEPPAQGGEPSSTREGVGPRNERQVSVAEVDRALRAALQRDREGNWEITELRRQVDRRLGARHASFLADLTDGRTRVAATRSRSPSRCWRSFSACRCCPRWA